jgi:ubiquinone/menaquinone biosynthesis C-methylase UbiE
MALNASPQQVAWSTGDFAAVGSAHTIISEVLCDSIPVYSGDEVLDVATGSGNAALAAARRGAKVTGIDFVEALLERARERAHAERLNIDFRFGDAADIPFPDESFDVVLSTFGAMFAPDPMKAASELLRVCRKGGRIGMANWKPAGFIGEMFRINSTYAPPPAGSIPPSQWGVPEIVKERFGNRVSSLQFNQREALFRHDSPEHWVEFMKKFFGPMMRAQEAAGEKAGEFTAALVDLAKRHHEPGAKGWFARSAYIEVIAVKA